MLQNQASESDRGVSQQIQHDIPDETFSAEQAKEAFDVARNCVELLATILSSSPQQEVLQLPFVCLIFTWTHPAPIFFMLAIFQAS
ncbi:hypothetical protein LIER_41723 [Lithospermum erythrorhizon]|uniref:Uncharacterized protein n=1 Tax=Lithospermum erythrorhizon TaxID=34254 RepID=A0AAV3RHK6_LITER